MKKTEESIKKIETLMKKYEASILKTNNSIESGMLIPKPVNILP